MPNVQYERDFILAFDFGGTKLVVVTAKRNGEILQQSRLKTSDYGDGQRALDAAVATGLTLVSQAHARTGGSLQSIGVATMGITRPDRVEMAPNVPGWETLRIGETLRRAYGQVPYAIENDVKSAALAEVRKGALQGTDYGLYVNFGTGIGMAYTVGARVLRGHHGAAGEIGYALRNPKELAGYHDGVAPFEEFAGGKAIGERASLRFNRQLTTEQVFELAKSDPAVKAFLDPALEEMAFQIANVIITWDPEKVAFGGGMMGAQDTVLSALKHFITRFVPFPPILTVSHFIKDAGMYGAIELACRELENGSTE